MITWSVSKEDAELIGKICDRGYPAMQVHGIYRDKRSMIMDITAVHANGNPLRLQDLLKFPEFDFIHDIAGIASHLNRKTGKLEHCFLPRSSRP